MLCQLWHWSRFLTQTNTKNPECSKLIQLIGANPSIDIHENFSFCVPVQVSHSVTFDVPPVPSARQHSSYGDCLEVKREYYQNIYVSSSYTFNRLSLSHWDPYAVLRGGCLELYYCNMVEWFRCDSSLISTTNWFPSVLWHCWFGHPACKNRPRNDLLCVEWDVKSYTPLDARVEGVTSRNCSRAIFAKIFGALSIKTMGRKQKVSEVEKWDGWPVCPCKVWWGLVDTRRQEMNNKGVCFFCIFVTRL